MSETHRSVHPDIWIIPPVENDPTPEGRARLSMRVVPPIMAYKNWMGGSERLRGQERKLEEGGRVKGRLYMELKGWM